MGTTVEKLYFYNNKMLKYNDNYLARLGSSGPSYPTDYLAYYPFQTDLNDENGSNAFTAYNNISFTTSPWGGAVNIENSSSKIYLTDFNFYKQNYFTLSYWVKTGTLGDAQISGVYTADAGQGLICVNVDTKWKIKKCKHTVSCDEMILNNINTSDWFHAVIIGNQSTGTYSYSFYSNGVKLLDNWIPNQNENVTDMGPGVKFGVWNWYGYISEAFFYDRILTDSEVLSLYNMHSNEI